MNVNDLIAKWKTEFDQDPEIGTSRRQSFIRPIHHRGIRDNASDTADLRGDGRYQRPGSWRLAYAHRSPGILTTLRPRVGYV
jgi:hypothetical protein